MLTRRFHCQVNGVFEDFESDPPVPSRRGYESERPHVSIIVKFPGNHVALRARLARRKRALKEFSRNR